MTVFDIAAGVSAGILLAALCLGALFYIHKHETNGTQENLWAYLIALFPITFIVLSFYLAM